MIERFKKESEELVEDTLAPEIYSILCKMKTARLCQIQSTIIELLLWREQHSAFGHIENTDELPEGSKYKISKIRQAALTTLEDACFTCGERDPRVLHIDHINGDGKIERSEMTQYQIYKKVVDSKGLGYQLLCANCHSIKSHVEGDLS